MSYRTDKFVIDGHTDIHTHTQAMTVPEGQNWPRVKTVGLYIELGAGWFFIFLVLIAHTYLYAHVFQI